MGLLIHALKRKIPKPNWREITRLSRVGAEPGSRTFAEQALFANDVDELWREYCDACGDDIGIDSAGFVQWLHLRERLQPTRIELTGIATGPGSYLTAISYGRGVTGPGLATGFADPLTL